MKKGTIVGLLVCCAWAAAANAAQRVPTTCDRECLRGKVTELLVRELSSTSAGLPLIAGFQLLGIAAVAFHLGYGIYRFDWQAAWLTAGRRRTWLAVGVGVLVLITASFAVVELATGKKLVPTWD